MAQRRRPCSAAASSTGTSGKHTGAQQSSRPVTALPQARRPTHSSAGSLLDQLAQSGGSSSAMSTQPQDTTAGETVIAAPDSAISGKGSPGKAARAGAGLVDASSSVTLTNEDWETLLGNLLSQQNVLQLLFDKAFQAPAAANGDLPDSGAANETALQSYGAAFPETQAAASNRPAGQYPDSSGAAGSAEQVGPLDVRPQQHDDMSSSIPQGTATASDTSPAGPAPGASAQHNSPITQHSHSRKSGKPSQQWDDEWPAFIAGTTPIRSPGSAAVKAAAEAEAASLGVFRTDSKAASQASLPGATMPITLPAFSPGRPLSASTAHLSHRTAGSRPSTATQQHSMGGSPGSVSSAHGSGASTGGAGRPWVLDVTSMMHNFLASSEGKH